MGHEVTPEDRVGYPTQVGVAAAPQSVPLLATDGLVIKSTVSQL